jgi:hypothetical protein
MLSQHVDKTLQVVPFRVSEDRHLHECHHTEVIIFATDAFRSPAWSVEFWDAFLQKTTSQPFRETATSCWHVLYWGA